MKKILSILLLLVMVISLAACGNNTEEPSDTSGQDTGVMNRDDGTDDTSSGDNNTEEPKDSLAKFGLTLEAITPKTSTGSEVKDESKRTYKIAFAMPENVSEDVGFAYYKQIYDLTASISEGGVNYKETGGSAINPEVSPMGSWEDEHSAEAHMNVWFYKYDGKLLQVTIIGGIGWDDEISFTISDYT